MPQWFRFYSETTTDRKIERICRVTGQPKMTVIGAWAILMSLANDSPIRGALLLTEDCPFSEQDLADEMGAPLELAHDFLLMFQRFRMVHQDNGTFYVTNWDKRQFSSDDSTERVRRYRQRHEAVTEGNSNGNETLQGRYSNAPDTDTDTETDTYTETETETETDRREQVAPPGNGSPPKKAKAPRKPKEPAPIAVERFREVTERYPHHGLWPDIQSVVGESPPDLERWQRTVKAWLAMGWNPTNVKGMLQHFHDKRIPGDDMKARGSPTGPPEPASYAALRAVAEEEGFDWQH